MIVFVDASFLIALFNKDDQLHKKAAKLTLHLERQNARFITSNIVLAETINVIFRLKGAKSAKKLYSLFKEAGIEEFFVPKAIFQRAYSLLWEQKRKGLNFFDCLHLVTMEHLKIKNLLTFDEGFKGQKIKTLGLD